MLSRCYFRSCLFGAIGIRARGSVEACADLEVSHLDGGCSRPHQIKVKREGPRARWVKPRRRWPRPKKRAQDRPKFVQHGPRIGPRPGQDRPRLPKIGPRSGQDRPRWAQERPKIAEDGPKIGPRSPKMAPNRSKIAEDGLDGRWTRILLSLIHI